MQSFASLSLEHWEVPVVPDSHLFNPSYVDAYDVNGSYSSMEQGSDPTKHWQSSSAIYGAATSSSSTYSATSHASLTGGYKYQSGDPSTSNYISYSAHNTELSSSERSYQGASVPRSGWSDTLSHATTASSAPSTSSTRTDVSNSIHRQRPPNEHCQLPCEFYNLTGCNTIFPGDDIQGWMDHIEGHLQSKFPKRLRCCK